MQITEPITLVTDYALALASFIFAVKVRRQIGPRTRVTGWFWCTAFVASGVAAFLGGTYHGFAAVLASGLHRALWNLTVYSMGVSTAFMAAGVHAANIRREDGTIKWLVSGIAVTIFGAFIQLTGFRRGENFNHNDVYHLIQIVGLYLLFRSASSMRDRPGV